jgi:periplasmic protein TonB
MDLVLPQRPDGSSHAVGFGVVVAVHLLIGYALLSGLAQKVVDSVRDPFEARLIDEPKKEPPPPPPEVPKPVLKQAPPPPTPYVPPPEVVVAAPPTPAPTITATTPVPPPTPVAFTPDPPPAPPAPAAPKAEPLAIGVACPTQVAPVLPRRAQQEGIAGLVRAQATIRGGKVVDVQILASKPRGLFDAAVRSAMLQYGCQTTGADEIVAQQTFEFRAPE